MGKSYLWIRRNLFAGAVDSILTVLVLALVAWLTARFLGWAIWDARWLGIYESRRLLLVGLYPPEETWRTWFMLAILCTATGAVMLPRLRRFAVAILLAACAAAVLVLAPPGLDRWGGLLLSLMLAIVVSAASLPLGILLAFGRTSRNPSLSACCAGYIEVMRSVPLILVVYWIWITVPLFLPDTSLSSLVRGMIGYTVFNAAYVAEFVRSGIQAVPRGQREAALSLGMSSWTVSTEIVLPQAVRVVQPALVGNVLDVFNGATLVFIIGLTDFLRAGQMILADPASSGAINEVYVFMFAVYFVIGSAITFGARRMEAHMKRSAR
ncbi:amino acid ABC transporter permease (plasmid) [Mesorhizobium sp. B2-1-8]|uniref:amino acid ABC transporter permease n=1 Tax=Mesorhizobium sp. B2-1-8 TaxID=2589967 RepID=UPI00112BC32A|nr:amino acid ABC transporter permease [Mesorhizobium sp. B2-1-8]UCI22996.1 amino acid ABC transporter permease [Mesorhizobium sp. B2-1-8]